MRVMLVEIKLLAYLWNINLFNYFSMVIFYFQFFSSLLNKVIRGYILRPKTLYFFFPAYSIYVLVNFIRYNMLSQFKVLTDIVVVDNPLNNFFRFEINYVFVSHVFNFYVVGKSFANSDTVLLSLSNFFKSAPWLEREIWDLYGLKFAYHMNLRRIMTDYGFRGFPLRKDFPLMGFVELRYDDLFQSILIEPLELSQHFRAFTFQNSWGNWK